MNRHIIHQYATIIEALRRLNELSGDVMTLIVTDESNRMLGTVTDGDIRRGLLNGVTPADLIDRVIHTGFMAIHTGQKPLASSACCRNCGLTEQSTALSTSTAPTHSSL